MPTKLTAALREKFGSPKAAMRALGLDESLISDLSTETKMSKPTHLANTALLLTAAAIRPYLAKDAKIDLMPVFKGVTSKNFKPKEIKIALDAALKGKLIAKDAEMGMGHAAQILDHLGSATNPETADESVSDPQHKAMEAAAHGESDLGISPAVGKEFTSKDANMEGLRGYLKDKGMDEDTINGACDSLGLPKSALDESPEDKEKREKEDKEKKAAADAEIEKKAAEDKAKDEEMKDMVKKPAMDAAIRDAVALTTKTIRETERGIRTALAEVKPWVGELPATIAFDSATDVYRHAAGMMPALAADAKTLHADALLQVIKAQPKPGARPTAVESPAIGMDSAGKSFAERHPEAARIQSV